MYQVLVVEGFVDLDDLPWQWRYPNSTIEESWRALKRTSSLEHPRTQKQNLTRIDQVVDGMVLNQMGTMDENFN